MEANEFKRKVVDLEPHQNSLVSKTGEKLIQPFAGNDNGRLECPWLHWRIEQSQNDKDSELNPEGIFLMQDWGNAEQELHEAIKDIRAAFRTQSPDSTDTTLRNLRASGWGKAIQSPKWVVSNAIWGLRSKREDKEASKCGYLGAELHKRAFLTWGRFVVELCRAVRVPFTLVVAGEWASFSDFPGKNGEEELPKYLRRWRTWVTTGNFKVGTEELPKELSEESLKQCTGRAIYVSHPATWRCNGQDWTKGPQPSSTKWIL